MAEAVALALSAAGATGAAATVTAYAAWINLAIAVAGSAYAAKEQRRRARNARRDAARDREITFRSAAAPVTYVYGRARTWNGLHLVDVFTTGEHQQYLHLVLRVCDHECEAFTGFWLAGQKLTLDDNGFVTSADFTRRTPAARSLMLFANSGGVITLPFPSSSQPIITTLAGEPQGGPSIVSGTHTLGTVTISGLAPNVTYQVDYTSTTIEPLIRVRTHLGAVNQAADTALVQESAGRWTSSMRGAGIAYIYVRAEFDTVLAPFDMEDWAVEVRGKRVLDPRSGAVAWSNNSELIARDWMLDARIGPAIASGAVPSSEIVAGANVCDEGVRTQHIYGAGYVEHFIGGSGGWTVSAGAIATSGGVATLTAVGAGGSSTPADTFVVSPVVSVLGAGNRYVRARVKRITGTGWQGTCYYVTSGHGHSESFQKSILPAIASDGQWHVLEWDMHQLSAGGTDWQTNTITGIRLDLGNTLGDIFQVDWIAIGGTTEQPRYTFDGAVNGTQSLGDILDSIMDSCAGTAVYAQGRWLVRPGSHRLPAITIDEASLSGNGDVPVKVVPVPLKRSRYNAVRAYYRDADANYIEVPAPIVRNAQYVAEDGGKEVVHDLRLDHICDTTRAQRLAKIELERHRQGLTCQVVTNLKPYDLVPTDTCALSLQQPGFAGKVFTVDSRSWAGGGELQYALTETAAEVWEWNDGLATVGDPAPNTTLRSPTTRPERITNLFFSAADQHRLRLSDDSYQRRVFVSWTPVTDTYVTQGGRIELETWTPPGTNYRALPSEPGDSSSTYIGPVSRGPVAVRVRAVNALGIKGDWSSGAIDVPDQQPVSDQIATIVRNVDLGTTPLNWIWQLINGVGSVLVPQGADPATQNFLILAEWVNTSSVEQTVLVDGSFIATGSLTPPGAGPYAGAIARMDLRVRVLSAGNVVADYPAFSGVDDGAKGFVRIDPNPPVSPVSGLLVNTNLSRTEAGLVFTVPPLSIVSVGLCPRIALPSASSGNGSVQLQVRNPSVAITVLRRL